MEVTIIKFRFWGILISLCIIQTLQLFFMDAWAQSNSTDSVTNFIEQTADGFEFDNISNDSLFNKGKDSICYPASCLTACSFDKNLLFQLGENLAKEARQNILQKLEHEINAK